MSRFPLEALARRYAPLLAASLLLVWHSLQFGFVTDDAYISFVFSENFAEHGQLLFNYGHPPVEGYTNFLWTFLLGLLMVVGLPPEVMSLILGPAFAIGSMYLALRILEHTGGEKSAWDYLAPTLLALSSGYACWSSGGLETQMFSFWVTLTLYSYLRAFTQARFYRVLGVALALAAMTRPEGLLIAAVIGGHRVLIKAWQRDFRFHRDELLCVGLFVLIWAPWFGWRYWYYGHLFPNTYYVKAAGEASAGYAEAMQANGRHYLWQWLTQSKMLWGAPLVLFGLGLAKPLTRRFVFGSLALLISAVYMIYVMRVGGDFMGLHRFVMPLFIIGAIGFALGLRLVVNALPKTWPKRWIGAGLAMASVMLFAVSQYWLTHESMNWRNWKSDNGIDTPSYLAVYAHDRKLIGEHMRSCFRDDDFSIFGGVGAKPYHAKAKGVDVFGLVSEEIAHQVPRTRPRAGHNKWAPDTLLYETYAPDFVFHCYGLDNDPTRVRINCCPSSDPGCERGNSFWQRKGYERVTLHVPGLLERGEYYTFFVAGDRVASFKESCSGVVE